MLSVALALLSSVLWGTADFAGGLLSRRRAVLTVLVVSQVSAVLGAAALVVLVGGRRPDAEAVAWAAGAGMLGVSALAAFYRGLAIGTMSIVAPVSATGAVVPVLFGVARGERPGGIQAVGIALALVGIVLAAREPGEARAARASIALAAVAALGFGSFFVGVEQATRSAGVPWVILLVRSGEVALLGLAVAMTRPRIPVEPRLLGALAAIGALDVAANATYALAATKGLLSVVAVVGSLYPAVTVLLARGFLHERVSRLQEAGVVAVLAGVVAISAG